MKCTHREPPESAFAWSHWATCECGAVRYEKRPGREWARMPVFGDAHYADLPEHINSRTKHRAYMKANNLTTVDDFTGTWAKAAKEREEVMSGRADRAKRREAIGRALHKLETTQRRR